MFQTSEGTQRNRAVAWDESLLAEPGMVHREKSSTDSSDQPVPKVALSTSWLYSDLEIFYH